MAVPDGGTVAAGRLIQPKVEAEVALVLGADLPHRDCTVADVIRATDFALAALEIVDSRIADWDITIVDTVADNASSGLYALGGTPVPLSGLDLRAARMTMTRGGSAELVSEGTGADCLGGPLNAAAWLASTLAAAGDPLRAGDGEIVASVSSRSAGPGTRANIDEFTETTSSAIEQVGGAARGKAIIVLNPAEPPLIMRDTVHCVVTACAEEAVTASVEEMVGRVQAYVPGYRLKQKVQYETVRPGVPLHALAPAGTGEALKVSVFLEVEGAAHYLPAYAGNLDVMTSAALRTAERMAAHHATEATK
nr:acetaldehyde dehydrogenase (acetylating) [Streptomyces sp. Alain-F2R5]